MPRSTACTETFEVPKFSSFSLPLIVLDRQQLSTSKVARLLNSYKCVPSLRFVSSVAILNIRLSLDRSLLYLYHILCKDLNPQLS